MRVKLLTCAAVACIFTASPSLATSLLPGTTVAAGLIFTPFNMATQGTLLASSNALPLSPATTFSGTMSTAVYRNTFGTLDFYYQFARADKAGLKGGGNPVEKITTGDFSGTLVDAEFTNVDVDGIGGIFHAANNPGVAPAYATRDATGSVIGADISGNPLTGTQISSTFIFRTNAKTYEPGTYGVIDASVQGGAAFEPGAAVPETSTWAMMVIGFGSIGSAIRRRRGSQSTERARIRI